MKKIYSLLVFFGMILLMSSCGSSVTETSRDIFLRDISLLDGAFEEDAIAFEEDVNDIISEDYIPTKDEGTKDIEEVDIISEDVEFDIIEDVEADVVYSDVIGDVIEDATFPDISGEDTEQLDVPVDAATDTTLEDTVIEDALSEDAITEDTGSRYCTIGDKKEYKCPDGSTIDYCICENKGCKPYCGHIGTESEGWYDCKGKLIKYTECAKCNVYCSALGSRSEGWYSDCGGLITWDYCAPDWFCLTNPEKRCGLPCTDSCDCTDKMPFCLNGQCSNAVPISCSNNSNLCPCGYYCKGDMCVAGGAKCNTSCDCPEGLVCVNGTCKEKMDMNCTSEPCPCGYYCALNPFGVNTCQKGCVENCDCPASAPICNRDKRECVVQTEFDCKGDDRNCPCMQRCVEGRCVKSDELCDNSCECKNPLREVCINGVCSGKVDKCLNDSECPCDMSCQEGKCVTRAKCSNSCDCAKGEVCRNGICIPYTSDMGCNDDKDCPCNYACINGDCRSIGPVPCTYSCDCPENMICQNGFCEDYVTYRCAKDNDCLCGYYCDISGGDLYGLCIQGCNDPCDCPKDAPYCIGGRCEGEVVPISCKSNMDCRCNEICKGGICISPK